MNFTDPDLIRSLLLTVGVVWGCDLILCVGLLVALRLALRPLTKATNQIVQNQAKIWRGRLTALIILLTFLAALGIATWAVWETGHGNDAWVRLEELMKAIPQDRWLAFAGGCGRVVLAAVGALIGGRIATAILTSIHRRVAAWSHLKAEPASVETFFAGLTRLARHGLWMLVAVYAIEQLFLPDAAAGALRTAIAIYLIITIGQLFVRATTAIVDTLDALSRTYLEKTSWLRWYDAVRPLVPLLRRCIESALWVGTASLAILQIEAMAGLAVYGPRVMEAIGLFFIARVAIELGHLLIDQRLLHRTDLDETRTKRNATFAPLLKTLFRAGVFFAAGVLMLGALGFNPMPFLAGAGILGVVIGLGAQPMINDLVSGFFIIFENQFLIGDTIEVEDARGTVEAIDFRTTRIRDIEGRVHLVRNGDLKRVVNHSKEYSNAVVRVGVPVDSNLATVKTALQRADQRVRESFPEEITGATTLTLAESLDDGCCITRTIVRTKPSRHWVIGAELRQLIIEELHAIGITPGISRQHIEINQALPTA